VKRLIITGLAVLILVFGALPALVLVPAVSGGGLTASAQEYPELTKKEKKHCKKSSDTRAERKRCLDEQRAD
jgi:hypothetical protein